MSNPIGDGLSRQIEFQFKSKVFIIERHQHSTQTLTSKKIILHYGRTMENHGMTIGNDGKTMHYGLRGSHG